MSRLPLLVQEFVKPAERPGVDHIVPGKPAPLGCYGPVAEVREVPRGVGVAVDGEDGSVPQRRPDQARGKAEAIREASISCAVPVRTRAANTASQSASMGGRLPISRVRG
jgi:hypothetical protein